ncbi:MAG: hypothetical protein MRZ54_04745 [Clostridiales bacterium]|nr:hypothetical protein [Clostridiales bacterium]
MKKLFSALLAVLMLCTASASAKTIDLSGMSYDELVALKDQINLALWESEKWEEVTVPQGVYQVGADIPAGHWTLKASETDSYASAYVKCGRTLSANKKDLEWDDYYASESLVSDKSKGYNPITDKTETDFELENGMYVIVEYSSVVFTPYTGKPSLGFK